MFVYVCMRVCVRARVRRACVTDHFTDHGGPLFRMQFLDEMVPQATLHVK